MTRPGSDPSHFPAWLRMVMAASCFFLLQLIEYFLSLGQTLAVIGTSLAIVVVLSSIAIWRRERPDGLVARVALRLWAILCTATGTLQMLSLTEKTSSGSAALVVTLGLSIELISGIAPGVPRQQERKDAPRLGTRSLGEIGSYVCTFVLVHGGLALLDFYVLGTLGIAGTVGACLLCLLIILHCERVLGLVFQLLADLAARLAGKGDARYDELLAIHDQHSELAARVSMSAIYRSTAWLPVSLWLLGTRAKRPLPAGTRLSALTRLALALVAPGALALMAAHEMRSPVRGWLSLAFLIFLAPMAYSLVTLRSRAIETRLASAAALLSGVVVYSSYGFLWYLYLLRDHFAGADVVIILLMAFASILATFLAPQLADHALGDPPVPRTPT